MLNYCKLIKLTVGVIIPLSLATISTSEAQVPGPISAFTTCIDANGDAGLCAQNSWDLAEGFSAKVAGGAAALGSGVLTNSTSLGFCGMTAIPTTVIISLPYADFRPGDRIYFEDIVIEAFNEFGDFIPELPIVLSVLSQADMLEARSDWDYVEVASFGYATFMARSYCGTYANVTGETQFSVAP